MKDDLNGKFKPKPFNRGWVGVDLDGTLAHYEHWRGIEHIGDPVPVMLKRVLRWLEEGKDVRIFTARVFPETVLEDATFAADFTPETWNGCGEMGDRILAGLYIREWCKKHIGRVLPITCRKDMQMVELWDDRAVGVVTNRGIPHETVPAMALHQVCTAVGIEVVGGQEYMRTAEFVTAHIRRLALNANKFRTACEEAGALVDGARDALGYVKGSDSELKDLLRAVQLLQKADRMLKEAR